MFRMSWLDKFKLRKELLAEEYGGNEGLRQRALKLEPSKETNHSFQELLNKPHTVAVVSREPVIRL